VVVIDTVTHTVEATVPVGSGPVGVAITPDGAHTYVANELSDTVSVVATATNTVVATVPVAPGSAPFRVAITPSASCLGTGVHRLRGQVRTAEAPPGLPDVTVTLTGSGGCQDTTTTHATGHYVFRTLGSGTYTVTPVKEGCTFTPPSRMVTLAEADLRAHFRGTCGENEEGERERKEHRD
jgi:YVTN family beta-propeller protein